jgi:polyisoprenoid-binding protein YceI
VPNTSGAFNTLNPQATPALASASTPATAVAAPAPAGALVFQITPGQSKATFRVREQLAGRDLPNDAVGSTSSVTGQLAIRPDGTVVSDTSKITVDLTSLATDQSMRDQFIKFNTLQTRQFATAEFVPTKVEGLPTPLPASGQYSFKLTSLMTIHGVQKELTWDVTAQRDGGNVTGTATTEFKFGDFGMTPPKAPAVLSVVDDIRLEVSLAATQAS